MMKLVTRIIRGISYLGLVLIFGFIFYRGFQDLAFNVQQLYKNSQYQGTTEGQITALQNRRYYYYGGIVYYPGIAFTVGDKTYTFWSYSSFDPNPSAFPLGGHVVVKYDTNLIIFHDIDYSAFSRLFTISCVIVICIIIISINFIKIWFQPFKGEGLSII